MSAPAEFDDRWPKLPPPMKDCPHCDGLGEVDNPDHDERIYCAHCLKRVDQQMGIDDMECPHCDANIVEPQDYLTHVEYLKVCEATNMQMDAARRDGLIR